MIHPRPFGCPAAGRRRAVTVVETALVLSITLLLLFGIYEYCRFIFLVQVLENAAREGARFAVARTADGTTLDDVQNFVRAKMGGRLPELGPGYTITVENVDPNTGDPVPNTQWNDAPFGGAIRVRITGTYTPMLPNFLHTLSSFTVRATSMMSSEAN
jgi:Flp pilus assembly protein TadG